MIKQQFTVTASDDGKRLDRLVRQLVPTLPFEWVQKAFRKKDIKLDGKKTLPSAKVAEGQVIALSYPDQFGKVEKASAPRDIVKRWRDELDGMLLYKDEDVFVFNKPRGLSVQGGSGIKKSLDQMLEAYVHSKKGRPKLVHRLDRDTSGVILVARTAAMARKLTEDFKEKTIEKTYHASVVGKPKKKQGIIDFPLKKVRRSGEEKVEVAEDGQEAVTHYRTLDFRKGISMLELKPITGRMHQLRVHCLALGTPIVGDKKYGGDKAMKDGMPKHLHLHAFEIAFKDKDGCDVVVSTDDL